MIMRIEGEICFGPSIKDKKRSATIGIDLGTTYSAVSVSADGVSARILQDKEGQDITPSVVGENPFTAAFGTPPSVLADRKEIIKQLQDGLEDPLKSTGHFRDTCFSGITGIGKSVLMDHMAKLLVRTKRWIHVEVTTGPDMLTPWCETTEEEVEKLFACLKQENSLDTKMSAAFDNCVKQNGTWNARMSAAFFAAETAKKGILITIDEIKSTDAFSSFLKKYQELVRKHTNIALMLAGLTQDCLDLQSGKDGVTFFARITSYPLGLIEDEDIKECLKKTIELGGKEISESELKKATGAANGYPYLLQLIGSHLWTASGESKEITSDAVDKGIQKANEKQKEYAAAQIINLNMRQRLAMYALSNAKGCLKKLDAEMIPICAGLRVNGYFVENEIGTYSFVVPQMEECVQDIKFDPKSKTYLRNLRESPAKRLLTIAAIATIVGTMINLLDFPKNAASGSSSSSISNEAAATVIDETDTPESSGENEPDPVPVPPESSSEYDFDKNLVIDQKVVFAKYKGKVLYWRVLELEGGYATLITDQLLEGVRLQYHNNSDGITWVDSDIRKWLNDEPDGFYNSLGDDKDYLVKNRFDTGNTSDDNGGGTDLDCMVWLLSYADDIDEESTQSYISSNAFDNEFNVNWWLRDPGYRVAETGEHTHRVVFYMPNREDLGNFAMPDTEFLGVRPVIKVRYKVYPD
jgi:hypothetical protein